MAETSNFSVFVKIVESDFHSSHSCEIGEIVHELGLGCGGFLGEKALVKFESFVFRLILSE